MCVSPTVSEIFSVKECRDLKTGGRCRSRSLKMAPYDRSPTTFYWSAIVSIAVCCTIFKLFDESLGAVSYTPSIATMAVSCIKSEIKRDNSRKSWFLPRDGMQARSMLSCTAVSVHPSVWPSVRLTRSWTTSKRINVSSKFFTIG